MNRRLFVRHLATGLVLPLLPFSTMTAFGTSAAAFQPLTNAVSLIQNERLGAIQTLTITHVYEPGLAASSALTSLVQQDSKLIQHLLGKDLSANLTAVAARSAGAHMGSHSEAFTVDGIRVVWQRLARYGASANTPTGSVDLMGSRAVLRINLNTLAVNAVSFDGKAL